jgi:hypothetical protein
MVIGEAAKKWGEYGNAGITLCPDIEPGCLLDEGELG